MKQIIIQPNQTLSGIAQQKGTTIDELLKLNPNITNPDLIMAGANLNVPDTNAPNTNAGQFSITTKNPALKQLFSSANQMLADYKAKGGTITPEMEAAINRINDFETQKISSLAAARAAANDKNAPQLDETLKTAAETEKSQQDEINNLLSKLKEARTSYISSLAPTEKETELRRKLQTLRTERQLLPLELRQEGISAAGIKGRQINDERVRAIQEQNLLFEIGLEQEARKYKTESIGKQMDFIKDDINLRQKIQDKLDSEQQQIIENARDMRKDSLAAMSDILDGFSGLAWEDLDPQSQADLADTAKQFDIPLNLLTAAMANAKKQQVFENALKTKGKSEDEVKRVQNLLTNFGKRDFVSDGYYKQVKATSTLSPSEFDKRFGYLVKGETTTDITKMAIDAFEQAADKNGYVTPQQWKVLFKEWIKQEGEPKEFESKFYLYQDPEQIYE